MPRTCDELKVPKGAPHPYRFEATLRFDLFLSDLSRHAPKVVKKRIRTPAVGSASQSSARVTSPSRFVSSAVTRSYTDLPSCWRRSIMRAMTPSAMGVPRCCASVWRGCNHALIKHDMRIGHARPRAKVELGDVSSDGSGLKHPAVPCWFNKRYQQDTSYDR